jgi:hypothetical protein
MALKIIKCDHDPKRDLCTKCAIINTLERIEAALHRRDGTLPLPLVEYEELRGGGVML